MPFSSDTTIHIGKQLRFEPHCGNTWMLCTTGQFPKDLETPAPFDLMLEEVLFDCSEARALICKVEFALAGHCFTWGALIARSDPIVNLRSESVHCNLLLSKNKPTISGDWAYGHPSFVSPNSEPYVRGFGVLSLIH